MKSNSLNILHLSDFHFGNFQYSDTFDLVEKIEVSLAKQNREVDIIIVSGDIFDGRRKPAHFEADRKKAIKFFDELLEELNDSESEVVCTKQLNRNDILFVPTFKD